MNAHRVNRETHCIDLCGFVLVTAAIAIVAIVVCVLFLVKQSTFQSTCSAQHTICWCLQTCPIWQMIYTQIHTRIAL